MRVLYYNSEQKFSVTALAAKGGVCIIDIEILRKYYLSDDVMITRHAAERCRERGILSSDIESAVMNGEIIESYPDDFPFPSCLILGRTKEHKLLHVCMSDEGSGAKIITAYFPSSDKWQPDFKNRKVGES